MTGKRYYLGNGELYTICDSNKGGSDCFNMLTKFEAVDLLNKLTEENRLLEIEDERWVKASEHDQEVIDRLRKENEQLRKDSTVLILANQDYRRENEQLKQIIYEDESQIIGEWSSHIQEDMKKLNEAYKSDDINDLIRFCKEG